MTEELGELFTEEGVIELLKEGGIFTSGNHKKYMTTDEAKVVRTSNPVYSLSMMSRPTCADPCML